MHTNQQVIDAFVNERTAQGGSIRSANIGDGVTVLYSYSTPIALITPQNVATFDARKYSVTTSKQANQARRACFAYQDLGHDEFRRVCKAWGVPMGGAR